LHYLICPALERPSICSARYKPTHIKIITIEKGSALLMAAVCKALNPPKSSKTEATTPSEIAQNILCQTGGFSFPPEVMISMTSDPESEEVTKNVTIRSVASKQITGAKGKRSRNI
jgi:hypothetical protein